MTPRKKYCSGCGRTLPEAEFPVVRKSKSARRYGIRSTVCEPCGLRRKIEAARRDVERLEAAHRRELDAQATRLGGQGDLF